MITLVLHCPYCDGVDIVRHGTSPQGKQRYRCREKLCQGRTFLLDYAYPCQSQHVKNQMVDLALNGSGIRDTARVLHVSTRTCSGLQTVGRGLANPGALRLTMMANGRGFRPMIIANQLTIIATG